MAHMTAVKDKQSGGAWLRMSDGRHVGYVHDMDDVLAILYAYNLNLTGPGQREEVIEVIHACLDREVTA
jgi:hypothetical protein